MEDEEDGVCPGPVSYVGPRYDAGDEEDLPDLCELDQDIKAGRVLLQE